MNDILFDTIARQKKVIAKQDKFIARQEKANLDSRLKNQSNKQTKQEKQERKKEIKKSKVFQKLLTGKAPVPKLQALYPAYKKPDEAVKKYNAKQKNLLKANDSFFH